MGRTIILAANPHKPEAESLVRAVAAELAAKGHGVRVSLRLDDDLSGEPADLAVIFGGDGTVLGALGRLGANPPPILAFNLGRLGYLAETPPDNPADAVEKALAGEFHVSRRMLLDAAVRRNGGEVWRGRALNEFVLSGRNPGRILHLSARVGGEEVMAIRGDGLIVSTATGSTAYALSAGGPVASPELRAMIITPICPHQLANRPLVLGPEEVVRLRHFGDDEACLGSDGKISLSISRECEVEIRASKVEARLLSRSEDRFGVLREKLGWGWGLGGLPWKN